ncbi:MAG: CRISPR-associated endoribonuclease Cas6, partial [Clostridia bacterium]|nr:CRISPR-associated endoribonuclease Cas6 [Clostridia bacterium]
LLRPADEKLAGSLHSMQQKPFSISPLTGNIARSEGKAWVEEGETYYFAIASVSDELTDLLYGIFAKMKDSPITIGKADFVITQISFLLPEETGFFTILSNSPANSKINFNFLSPTCFRSHDRWMLFPEPSMVFNGLWEKWNAFSETPLPPIDPSVLSVTNII